MDNILALFKKKIEFYDFFNKVPKDTLGKLFYYPLSVTFRKIFFKNKTIVKNTLFWGDVFLTKGFFPGIYFFGFLPDSDEVRLSLFFLKDLDKGSIFFDVGSHFGFYSLLINRFFVEGVGYSQDRSFVHAFEPCEDTFKILSLNTEKTMIKVNNCAVSNVVGRNVLYLAEGKSGSNSLYKEFIENQGMKSESKGQEVRVTTLDEYCKVNNVVPTHIKIDAEGSEQDVIEGGLGIIKRHSPTIVIEFWPLDKGGKHYNALELLKDIGYSFFSIDDEGDTKEKELSYFEKLDVPGIFVCKKVNNE